MRAEEQSRGGAEEQRRGRAAEQISRATEE
jgi:hypothetical protein